MKNFIKNIIFNSYNFLTTVYENNFLLKKKNISINSINEKGFEKFQLSNKFDLSNYFKKKIKGPNDYLNIFIIEKEQIHNLIEEIFVKNKLKSIVQELTGFSYSIDFFVAYETLHIPIEHQQKQIYANHWHRDKPFSKNTIKIIIPIDHIGKNHGGIEVLDKSKSRNYLNNPNLLDEITNLTYYKMTGNKNDFFIFLPNVCLHRAGNPNFDLTRKQIMFQLNPYSKWSYNNNLFSLQFAQEPKFPLFKYYNKRTIIK